MRFPNLSECMGIEQAMEGKGGNCGFMHLPTKLPVHLKLPDFCSLKCWRTDCQQVVLFHRNSSLLRGRSQCGTSYFFIRYFFIKGCVLGNPLFHCRLGRCVAEVTSSQSFPVKPFPSYFIVSLLSVCCCFFFPQYTDIKCHNKLLFTFLPCPFPASTESVLPDPFPVFIWLISVISEI